ncbi:hypothetical protein ACIRPQ_28995 [Streptomyces sp. NPDC101213]|uniref:hypothetical protein n=1 Tax=Streptomyces sp. NPDC101213 TaxID=3366130 RepID=UPI0037F28D27
MTDMDIRKRPGGTDMVITEGIEPGQPAAAFGPGDVFEMPDVPGVLFHVTANEVYRHPVTGEEVPAYRYMTFTRPAGALPVLVPAGTLLVARLMVRRWNDVPCMLCRRTATLEHDMVALGRVNARVCASCS